MKSWIGEQLEFGIKGGEEGMLCLGEIIRIELKTSMEVNSWNLGLKEVKKACFA